MKKGKKIGIIAGIIAVLAFIIVFLIWLAGPGALTQKDAIKSHIQAMINHDADDYLDACFPKDLQESFKKKYDTLDDDGPFKKLLFENGVSDADDVRKINIIDKKIGDYDTDIKKREEAIKDLFDVEIKISEMVCIKYEFEIKVDGRWEMRSHVNWLYKTSGKWFVSWF